MSFEEVKEVFVDTLNCDADKVTMDASLTDEDLGTLKTVGDIFNYLAARAA